MCTSTRALAKLCLPLALLLAAALAVLALDPDLDLAAARAFYAGHAHFIGQTPAGTVVRYTAWAIPFLVYVGCLVSWLVAKARRSPGPSGRALLFLTLSLAIGPGLLVHAGLKELSHRPRPYDITAFGGRETFRPFTRFDGACPHNCAFASGETAATTWMLAPASLVPPPWRGLALAAAVAFAATTGLLRMAFGAHFLSDVCGGALVTLLVVLALRATLLRHH
ncbi:Membrane-associated enzyme, PAP2 (Acid phosphatase) superfamily [Beijerinckiaceae bacterium RH AL1]|nr:phosphatase PAP2 family protein [Beijerinckiaceae bacterium]VVB43684.1 Membrane-associated enzyme, PAP2 (Acid phosphatase) superfamily [Beijerinckiaceae bacterium RH AL8]VVB43701.1 Membrane-associated enzyme, PAP2 (Acid phosphatase) superfamily [Beijerinckiaceae bacterium RH CH11]VVC53960.1 Membrane-associated enzyme, PAP2 (Acid phosphatase) superfamily [Beijerinckiaceae bacterium RH AL1]